jgi:regulatory protein
MALITKIEQQKNKKDKVNIYVDDEFFCAMQSIVCVKFNLKENLDVEKLNLEKIVLESDKEKALNKVAKLISKGPKTEKQINEYLTINGYDYIIKKYVLNKLKDYNYLNDEEYANMYISTYNKKFGKRKLEIELVNNGIKKETISKLLSEFESSEDVILNLAKKHLKDKPKTQENLQKVVQHLSYKGFSWDEISNVLNKLKKE